MKILGIHGAFSSPTSMNYIREKLECEWISVNYSSKYNGIQDIIDDLNDRINFDCYIIGHSMGGLIGANLLSNNYIQKLVTISSPLDGLRIPYFTKFFMMRNFINEIDANSTFMRNSKKTLDLNCKKVSSIITNRGNPVFFNEPNDGVLTVKSQDYGRQRKYNITASHSEILQMRETVDIVKKEFGK